MPLAQTIWGPVCPNIFPYGVLNDVEVVTEISGPTARILVINLSLVVPPGASVSPPGGATGENSFTVEVVIRRENVQRPRAVACLVEIHWLNNVSVNHIQKPVEFTNNYSIILFTDSLFHARVSEELNPNQTCSMQKSVAFIGQTYVLLSRVANVIWLWMNMNILNIMLCINFYNVSTLLLLS